MVSKLKVRVDMTVTSSYEMRSVVEGLSLERKIIGYPSVSLSPTLGRNE